LLFERVTIKELVTGDITVYLLAVNAITTVKIVVQSS